jgi:HAD superfamily hydrolase (TIGR01549 family)
VIEAVFFDAGETLLRPHPSFAELFAAICHENGRPISAEQIRAVQEKLAPHLVDLAEDTGVQNPTFSEEGSRTFWIYLYRRFLDELGLAETGLEEALYQRFSDSSSYMLFDDVLPALDALARDHRLGLISNFEGWLEERLVELEVGPRFEVTVISGVELVEKPDPGIYELALERIGLPAARCAHVGDSIKLDVEPAMALGMRAILLDRADRYPEPPCPKIATLEDLPRVIANL